MYPHRIRLHGPWDCEPLSRLTFLADGGREVTTADLPLPRRMTLPCRWRDGGLIGFAGRVRFRRRFGLPHRLDAHERVWLTLAGIDSAATIWLNGQLIDEGAEGAEPLEFEITEKLNDRNELVVDVESNDDNGGLWGEVALEIRCLAFLRHVRAWRSEASRRLVVEGEVVGTEATLESLRTELAAISPLELYVVLDRSTIAYATVSAAKEGKRFQLAADDLPPSTKDEVLVQLILGATIWYEIICKIESEPSSNRCEE